MGEEKKKGGAKKRHPLTAAVDKVLGSVEGLTQHEKVQSLDIAKGIVVAQALPPVAGMARPTDDGRVD